MRRPVHSKTREPGAESSGRTFSVRAAIDGSSPSALPQGQLERLGWYRERLTHLHRLTASAEVLDAIDRVAERIEILESQLP